MQLFLGGRNSATVQLCDHIATIVQAQYKFWNLQQDMPKVQLQLCARIKSATISCGVVFGGGKLLKHELTTTYRL